MKKLLLLVLVLAQAALASSQGGGQTTAQGGIPPRISPEAAKVLLASDRSVVLLDVRTAEEFQAGHIEGAVLLPYDLIDKVSAARAIKDSSIRVIVYCRSGRRSAIAAETLRQLGYTKVQDLGGILDWPYGLVK